MPDPQQSTHMVADFQSGNDRARNFELIFRTYCGSVRGYFERQGFTLEEAQDLAQDVFLVVYSDIASLKDPASFRSWLFGIARHKLLRHLERRKRHPVVDAEDERDRVAETQPDALSNVLDGERRGKLRDALEELPQQMRACVKLSVVDELEYSEIATRLGLSVGTVKVHIHRARRNLAARLGPLFGQNEAEGPG